jgi:hypothetical protein
MFKRRGSFTVRGRLFRSPRVAAIVAASLLGLFAVVAGPASPASAVTPGDCWNSTVNGVNAHFCQGPQWLNAGQSWYFGADKSARLYMQNDGNLVIYDTRNAGGGLGKVKWASGTSGSTADEMWFEGQVNDHLYVTDAIFSVYWFSPSTAQCSSDREPTLALQDDHNLVIYCHKTGSYGPAIWASHSTY